ncbi:transglycosylase family protein [Streptomyces sporangiiformans]|uniref:LysM peptidoglycan-binding domain-containing protein n=1 Tax=Streptomyces sporangiiformans TaxID=2315329 RepID=A0A505DGK6_9ACTN|nr:transglycosylase family protein [Streptomyces sporangiiformans]TPQ17119.1 LysM peptidoglycan-binding domain-containing protein [Streptomyces sporangiiformans]
MLSGNGRHRRPRQAPALFVAAGVTGSAIAIPLLGATGASAASGATWDAIADCESGGSWSADTGNGRYGGLQMTQETWEQYGGLDYAASADQASRSQQIAVAEKVVADKGTSAWATCGLVAGLTQDSDAADVDTGVADDSASSSADSGSGSDAASGSDSTKSDTSGSSDASDTSDTSGTSDESDKSDTSDSSRTSEPSSDVTQDSGSGANSESSSGDSTSAGTAKSGETGRHRGGSAEEGAAASRAGDSTGRHASRAGTVSREAVDGSYVVRPGDNLWAIADSLGVEGGWPELYAENKQTVGADPDLILPGQRLEVGSE